MLPGAPPKQKGFGGEGKRPLRVFGAGIHQIKARFGLSTARGALPGLARMARKFLRTRESISICHWIRGFWSHNVTLVDQAIHRSTDSS